MSENTLYIQLQCYGNEQRKTVSFIYTIQTHGPFLRGLFWEGLIYGGKFASQNRLGLHLEGHLRLKIDWASL